MALTLTTPNTVLGVLSPKSQSARLVANLVTVVLGSLVLALSAKISVPVMPIPVTLQTMAVAALAAGFGWRIGVATVALYIVQGLSGLPVFATGGGIDYIAWKINRHAGTNIEIRPWQRRWPLLAAISLLPRLLRSGAVR